MIITLITIMSQNHNLEQSFKMKAIFPYTLMVGLYIILVEIYHFNNLEGKLIY